MPSTTTHYGLKIYDREADKTQYFIDFRDALAGSSDSNMTKIDKALHTLSERISPFEYIIVGDGISKDFLVPESGTHGKNTMTPTVSLIDTDTSASVTAAYDVFSANQVMIRFKTILPVDKKYRVLID